MGILLDFFQKRKEDDSGLRYQMKGIDTILTLFFNTRENRIVLKCVMEDINTFPAVDNLILIWGDFSRQKESIQQP
ncbi:hypothetical protein EG028_11640 [Chitinophaga barathri]|uniref:Uncharacterized protein n=1 Tax=Chitinophaga barathri TaxID=1647451 RepID=A0A3N4MCP7_9BACT|nr:hypothetical protein EG028_11640 [Chitinophaga barathri]